MMLSSSVRLTLACLVAASLFLSACKDERTSAGSDSDTSDSTQVTDVSTNAPTAFPGALPEGLLVDGQPIDPFCFAIAHSLEDGMREAPVKNCTSEDLIREEMFRDEPQAKGVYFRYKGAEQGMSRPYILYQYVGQDLTLPPSERSTPLTAGPEPDEAFPLILYTSGGGTGDFSTLMWVVREGDVIVMQRAVSGGDRCTGGIAEALINEDGKLTYSQNVTPYDLALLTIPEDKWDGLRDAYESLDYCAVCCTGTAEYVDDTFAGVTIPAQTLADINKREDYGASPSKTAQNCFDQFLLDEAEGKNEGLHYTAEEWTSALERLNAVCFPSLSSP